MLLCLVGPHSKKFDIVSNEHGRTQKCDFCNSACKINFTDHHTPEGCLCGNWKPSLDEYYYVQGFEKNWLPRKILLVNVHFTDQNHDRRGFSVFLLEPGNML